MSPEDEQFPDDEDSEEYAPRSIFAAGWFRAVLVLTVLAIAVVIALPYLLDWFEPASGPVKAPARPEVAAPAAPSPGPPAPVAPSTAPVPAPPPVAPPSAPAPATSAAKAPPPSAEAKPALPSSGAAKEPPVRAPAAPVRPAPPPAMAAKQKPQGGAMKLPEPARPAAAGAARTSPAGPGDAAKSYWVQVGVFTDPKNAADLARKLRADGFSVDVATVTRSATPSGPAAGTYQIVRAGSFPNEPGAVAGRDRLRAKGFDGFLTQGAAK